LTNNLVSFAVPTLIGGHGDFEEKGTVYRVYLMVSYISNTLFFHGAASWIMMQSSHFIWISTVIMHGTLHNRTSNA